MDGLWERLTHLPCASFRYSAKHRIKVDLMRIWVEHERFKRLWGSSHWYRWATLPLCFRLGYHHTPEDEQRGKGRVISRVRELRECLVVIKQIRENKMLGGGILSVCVLLVNQVVRVYIGAATCKTDSTRFSSAVWSNKVKTKWLLMLLFSRVMRFNVFIWRNDMQLAKVR